jgi:hypothetical protein
MNILSWTFLSNPWSFCLIFPVLKAMHYVPGSGKHHATDCVIKIVVGFVRARALQHLLSGLIFLNLNTRFFFCRCIFSLCCASGVSIKKYRCLEGIVQFCAIKIDLLAL